jgi:hypothetical protein
MKSTGGQRDGLAIGDAIVQQKAGQAEEITMSGKAAYTAAKATRPPCGVKRHCPVNSLSQGFRSAQQGCQYCQPVPAEEIRIRRDAETFHADTNPMLALANFLVSPAAAAFSLADNTWKGKIKDWVRLDNAIDS